MKRLPRRLLAVAVSLAVTFAIVGLSRVPYGGRVPDEAVIRLSWRTPGVLVDECRRLTQEELDRLPIHMRREEVCEGRLLPYRLRVLIDDRQVLEQTVRGAGAREDRPLYVFREVVVAPGSYRLEVHWEQAPLAGADAAGAGEMEERAAGDRPHEGRTDATAAGSEPAYPAPGRPTARRVGDGGDRLGLNAALRLEAGDVALITYDVDRRELVAAGRGIVSTSIR